MPHAFKATPSHPAVAYLVRLHADIGGQILDAKKEAGRLAASMLAVEHVIKLFDPDFKTTAIAARRRQRTNPWFKRAGRAAQGHRADDVPGGHGCRADRQGHHGCRQAAASILYFPYPACILPVEG